eukprot:342724-Pelagomonas_calceolata.AAC.3
MQARKAQALPLSTNAHLVALTTRLPYLHEIGARCRHVQVPPAGTVGQVLAHILWAEQAAEGECGGHLRDADHAHEMRWLASTRSLVLAYTLWAEQAAEGECGGHLCVADHAHEMRWSASTRSSSLGSHPLSRTCSTSKCNGLLSLVNNTHTHTNTIQCAEQQVQYLA